MLNDDGFGATWRPGEIVAHRLISSLAARTTPVD
jgi:hypothetical protein